MIAVWGDGVTIEDDPGVVATLILPDLSAQNVVGTDILIGLEQQITTDSRDGDLIIPGLLVRDYPIFLRLTGITGPSN